MDTDKQIIVSEEYALIPSNQRVISIANKLNWRPTTLINRVKSALPATLEQQIYITIAKDFSIFPESLAKLLRKYLGYKELQLSDLKPSSVDKNISYSVFNSFSEYLRECLNLLKIVNKEYSGFSISIEYAADIVLAYGNENPEVLIEMIDTNLDEMCYVLGINDRHSYSKKMQLCIWLMLSKIIPENRRNGNVDPLDITDILEDGSSRRNSLRNVLGQQLPDLLSEDFNQLRNYDGCKILKKEGLI